MMATPDQARRLWCPMVRAARREEYEVHTSAVGGLDVVHTEQFIPGGCNTDALGKTRVPASCRCIADECAMWRWEKVFDPAWIKESEHAAAHGEVLAIAPKMARGDRGYCGLAGRPEVAA